MDYRTATEWDSRKCFRDHFTSSAWWLLFPIIALVGYPVVIVVLFLLGIAQEIRTRSSAVNTAIGHLLYYMASKDHFIKIELIALPLAFVLGLILCAGIGYIDCPKRHKEWMDYQEKLGKARAHFQACRASWERVLQTQYYYTEQFSQSADQLMEAAQALSMLEPVPVMDWREAIYRESLRRLKACPELKPIALRFGRKAGWSELVIQNDILVNSR